MAINSFPSQWIVPEGVSVAFGSAPVAVVVDDLDEAQPNTIAMVSKIAANFLKLLILDLLVGLQRFTYPLNTITKKSKFRVVGIPTR
jgi:hypothetical protein